VTPKSSEKEKMMIVPEVNPVCARISTDLCYSVSSAVASLCIL
jgi:hypothetical protein